MRALTRGIGIESYHLQPEAEAAILPCLPDHLRRQVLVVRARLLEIGGSIEKPSRRQSQYQIAERPPVSIRRRLEAVFATDKGISLSC
jgi:hypothetical protein